MLLRDSPYQGKQHKNRINFYHKFGSKEVSVSIPTITLSSCDARYSVGLVIQLFTNVFPS